MKSKSNSINFYIVLGIIFGISIIWGIYYLSEKSNEKLRIRESTVSDYAMFTLKNKNLQFDEITFVTDKKNPTPSYSIKDGDAKITHLLKGELNKTTPKVLNQDGNDAILFENVFQDTDIKYTPSENSVKEEIILKSKPEITQSEPLEYEFILNIDGFEYSTDPTGNIIPSFYKSGENGSDEEYKIMKPFMTDAKGQTSYQVIMEITESENPNELKIIVRPDTEWLLDTNTSYPVSIDPTLTKGVAPVAVWRFDEEAGTSASDDKSTNNRLTVFGADWVTDNNNRSNRNRFLDFNGTTDILVRNDDTGFDFGTGSFSVSGWFRHPETISAIEVILSRYGTAGFRVYLSATGTLCFGIDDDSTWGPDASACSTATYLDSAWHHFEAVKTGTTSITLYVDRIKVAENTGIGGIGTLTNSTNLTVGGLGLPATDTTTTALTTSTDEGLGTSYGSWSHRNFYDLNNFRWHVLYIDSDGDIHSRSSLLGYETSWTDGIDIDTSYDYDYEDFSCVQDNTSGKTYLHCTYSDEADQYLFYRRCELTGSNNYIKCEDAEQTVYTSADANDDISYPRITMDSSRCNIIIADLEDNSEADNDEHEVWLFKEAATCGDGVWSTHASYPQADIGEASFTNPMPVGIEAFLYGSDNYVIYYINTDSTTSADLQKLAVNGTTNVPATDREFESDVEFDSRSYWSITYNTDYSMVFALDDGSTDLDGYYASTHDGGRTQRNTNIDMVTTATPTYYQAVTAIVDSVATDANDIWVFATDDVANYNDIYYNTSTNGTDFTAGTGTLWVENAGDSIRNLSGIFTSETCDAMIVWVDATASPFNIRSKTINTGSCTTGVSSLYEGNLDEIAIYNYARTEMEIKQDYLSPQVVALVGSTPQDIITSELIGYWPLDESSGNATDYSGNDYTLTDGSTTTYAPGKFANGADLESGSTDYLYSADNASFSITGNVTISAWIKPESVTAATSFDIAGKWDGANESYLLQQYGDEIYMYIDAAANYVYTTGTNLTAGNWYHVVGTYNSTDRTVRIYVNGDLQATSTAGTIPSSIGDDAGRFHVGAEDSTGGATNYYDGIVDDVRLYNKYFTERQVRSLYDWGPGPVAYWKMDDGLAGDGMILYDSSVNELNGTSEWGSSGMDCNQPGKYGKGCEFDTNDYILVSDNSNLDFTTTESFTLEAWIKHDTNSVSQDIVVAKYETTGGDGGYKIIMESDGDITCGVDTDNSGFPLDSATSTAATYDNNAWHHVACVKNGSTELTLFIDGVEIISDTSLTSTGTYANNDNFYIGIDGDGTSNGWLGRIDDVRVYRYARTDKQVVEDMNAGHPGVGSPIGSPVMYLRLDEGYGDTAYDSSSRGNNADLAGSCPGASTCPTRTNSGKIGKALSFDGGDYLSIASNTSLNPDEVSLSAWFNSDLKDSNYRDIIRKESQYMLRIQNTNELYFCIYSGGWYCLAIPAANWSTGQWNHLTGTFDGLEMKMYLNGKKLSSGAAVVTLATSANTLYIGSGSAAAEFWDGYLDEVRIYDYALNEDEVNLVYNQGKTMSVGALSTETSTGANTNTDSRRYCVPGDTASTCNSPVGEWKFDEHTGTSTVYDTSGNGYNLSTSGSMTESDWIPGKFGTALDFDGVDDQVNDADTGDYLDLTGAFTYSAWVYPEGSYVDWPTIMSKAQWPGARATWLGISQTSFYIRFTVYDYSTGGYLARTSTTYPSQNKWSHVVGVYDGGTTCSSLRIYMDGVRVDDADACSGSFVAIENVTEPFRIGLSTGNGEFDGRIDDVKVYNYARTPAQVVWEFNQGAPIAHWRFDECTGTTTYDSAVDGNGTSNGNTGTIVPGAGANTSAGTCSSGTGTEIRNNGTSGQIYASLDFDGTDDYVRVANANKIDLNNALLPGFSVSAWIKPSSDGENSTGEIFDKGANTYCRTDSESGSSMDLQCSIDLASGDPTLNISAGITTNAWNHIVLVWENDSDDEFDLYINGIKRGTSTGGSGDPAAESNPLLIGGDSSNNFDGLIDEFKIYNYPLTSEQINVDKNNGAFRIE